MHPRAAEERESESLSAFVDKARVREVLENYFHGLDARDEDRLAACFTDDAIATHHYGSETEFTLNGSAAIARYFYELMSKFTASSHSATSSVITVSGDTATADTFATVHVVSGDRVRIRGIKYVDALTRVRGHWRISKRTHTQLWQYEAAAVKPFLPR